MISQPTNSYFFQESSHLYFCSSTLFGSIGILINYQLCLFSEELFNIALSSFCSNLLLIVPYLLVRHHRQNSLSHSLDLIDLMMLTLLPFLSSMLASVLFELAFAPIVFNQLLGLGTLLGVKLASQALFSILERQQNKNNFSNTLNL